MSLTTADQEIHPAFSARLKARNPVLAAADCDGHLFRIFYERRRRLGWRKRLSFTARTVVLLLLVPIAIVLVIYLNCIGIAIAIGIGVWIKKLLAFKKVDGPFPMTVSDIYADHGCHARIALDLYLCGVSAREIMEAIYAECALRIGPILFLGWASFAMLVGSVAWHLLAAGYHGGAGLLLLAALLFVVEGLLMFPTTIFKSARSKLRERHDLWLGEVSAIDEGLRIVAIGVLALLALWAVGMFGYGLTQLLIRIIGFKQWGYFVFVTVVIIGAISLIDWARRRSAQREAELLEQELARGEVAHRALMTKLGLLE